MKFVYVEGVIIIFFFSDWIARPTLLVLFFLLKRFRFCGIFTFPFISDCLCLSQTVFEFWPLYNTTTSHIAEKTNTPTLDCTAIKMLLSPALPESKSIVSWDWQMHTISNTKAKTRINMYNIKAVLFFTNFAFCTFFFRNVMTGYKQ